jgi:hypothetical protein
MTAVELKACLEVEDPALPMPVEGYDVLYCVLQAGIRHATAPVPSLPLAVLWP